MVHRGARASEDRYPLRCVVERMASFIARRPAALQSQQAYDELEVVAATMADLSRQKIVLARSCPLVGHGSSAALHIKPPLRPVRHRSARFDAGSRYRTRQPPATERLTEAMDQSRSLRQLMLAYAQITFIQASACAVGNAHHRLEARLARWLLMCHDRVDGDEIHLTHEFMAMMIASQHSGVTVTLRVLECIGAIRSKRPGHHP